ncbi:MAG: Gfo/Idh/MocA family oxidoreductase, partial [Myxococcales bacterium]|nr:Gfo/Idh/MocA family oxidoreductase [Myxococcales bacterium]
LGMIGGGAGAGIAPTHRRAARLDGRFEIVAGAFSRNPVANRAMADELGVEAERAYADFETMAAAEAQRNDGIECVSIVTPNDTHAAASLAFMRRGIDVICDKPIACSLAEAIAIEKAAAEHGVVFALTHNYSAYPMVIEARHRIDNGELGAIRVVTVEYAHGTRNRLIEAEGDAKMAWRVNASIAGPSTVLGDIGTHAHHLMRRMTGLEVESVSAELSTMVPGRVADDNAFVSLRFVGGARGQLWASMVAAGNGHGLRIRVFGETASLHWDQEQPEELVIRADNAPYRTLRRGENYLCDAARYASRTKAGNPEGYFGAFANVYADAAEAIAARRERRVPNVHATSFATTREGVIAMKFIEAAVESSHKGAAWVPATLDLI